MRILLSAFGFGPGEGSESGGAWRWANELAKTNDVVVVTDGHNLRRIGAKVAELKQPRLTVLYYRPWWITRMRVTSKTSQFVFGQWQFGLMFFARKLHCEQPFDLCHHISYGVFRQASWLGFVGPPFVFGPVGGGEDAPWRLKGSLPTKEKVRELARALVNKLPLVNPLWHFALMRADLVIARTVETRNRFPPWIRRRTIIAQEIGTPAGELPRASQSGEGQPLRLLFVGRLLGWKGAQFALGAVHLLRLRGVDVRLKLVGSGPMRTKLHAMASHCQIDDRVEFVESLPQVELFKLYSQAQVFLFPSLHDSGGNVVLEALAAGLPVVCLDLGGPAGFVDASCGAVVPARDAKDEQELVARLTDAIASVAASAPQWQLLQAGALARAEQLTWERQIAHIQAEIQRMLRLPEASEKRRVGEQP